MKEGQLVNKLFLNKNGKMIEIIIRFPRKNDFYKIWKFYNKAVKETPFLTRITPVSRNEEKKWFDSMMKEMKRKDTVYLVAEHKGKIIGSAAIERKKQQSHRHVGIYGIAVLQKYTGFGLGKRLTKCIIELSKKEMKLEIITLSVYHKNKIAFNLYKKLGFKYSGKIPNGAKRNGKYMDELIMYKAIK